MRKNLSIILTILTASCGIIGYYFSIDRNILIICAALLLLILLLSFEHFETKSGKATHYSIYDKFKGLFFDSLKNPERNHFKSRFENLLLVGIDEELSTDRIASITKHYTNKGGIKPTVHLISKDLKAIDEEKQKSDLYNKLKSCDGVIFVRTKTFDKYIWIIDIIDEWGVKNSSFAVLRIDYLIENSEPNNSNKKAQHFQLIPSDTEPDILPWHLYSRINERSLEWRSQASFNRLIVIFLSLTLFLSFLAHLVNIQSFNKEKSSYYDHILKTERDLLKEKYKDLQSLNLSIWIKEGNNCIEIAKTHDQVDNYTLATDSSLIGYSMKNLGDYFYWSESKPNQFSELRNNRNINNVKIAPIAEHDYQTIIATSITQQQEIMGICADISSGVDTTMQKEIFFDELNRILRRYYFEISK